MTLRELMNAHVQRGTIPGVVTAIRRGERVAVEVLGKQSLDPSIPMRRDTIFRITSMTKPVTAAAAMILVDEGRLALGAPVDTLLPELANRRVLRHLDGPLDDTVPAARRITLRHLLTFTFGFGMVWGPPDGTPIAREANALKLGAFGPPRPLEPPAPDEWMRRFATLPLMHQPGEGWAYNTGAEVLGVLIARAAGKSLDAFMRERIFEPLGMHDTAFSVPEEKLHRFGPAYVPSDPTNPDAGQLRVWEPARGEWASAPAFPSGGAGLASTADDFLAFATALLRGGSLGKTRILSPDSVAAMTRDQLDARQKAYASAGPWASFWKNHGWGFGMSVLTGPDELTDKAGRYGWDGGFGTTWANDPNDDMVAIMLTQRMAFPLATAVNRDFWTGCRDH